MSQADQIQQLLSHKPGLKAQQIATELGLDRSQVVTTLHALLGGQVTQDNAYRWWPKARSGQAAGAAPAPRTFLASLCRYYLECLSRESGSGISIPAANQSEYVALAELPFIRPDGPWATDRALKRIVQKVRRERSQLTLYLGYAVRLRCVQQRNEEEMRIEPVLLYPIEETQEDRAEGLRPSSGVPLFNLEVLKSLPSADSGNVIDEAIHLADELGLANVEDDLPQWDEIILRLERCRPDWGWKESLNPYKLSADPPLADLSEPGIYNRAVLFAGTRSPFTYGLEVELRKLAQLEEESVRDTALGMWLRGESIETAPPEDRPILEVLPLNTEQRQAVIQGLSAPLTVVTGPPGTGKSQVVTSLLANVAWQGGSALFSSKNNHAVDVVESRVNDLGPYPLLLRLGKEEHHARIAQHLTSALAESSSPDDAVRYAWLTRAHEQDRARFAGVQDEIKSVVTLRNEVDELERAAEPARTLFSKDAGAQLFAGTRSPDADAIRPRFEALAAALDAARESNQPGMVRLLWDSMKGRRFERISEAAGEVIDDAELLGVAPPPGPPNENNLPRWQEFYAALSDRLEWAVRVEGYRHALDRLRAARPIELLAGELTRIAEESAHNALDLWQCWLRLRPTRWNPEQRKLLSEYVALLQMISSGDRYEEGAGRRVFRRYYSVFPKVAKTLPCWAVTSLSARGRLPFEPGFFDLVVIDEASQCDIAFRASVVVPGQTCRDHRRPVAAQACEHCRAARGSPDSGGARTGRRTRGLGVFGELAVRPRPQPVPPRRHCQSARSSSLAPGHYFVFQPALLSRQPAHRYRSRSLEPSAGGGTGGAVGRSARQGGASVRRRRPQCHRGGSGRGRVAEAHPHRGIQWRDRHSHSLPCACQPHTHAGAPGPGTLAATGVNAVRGRYRSRIPGR
jgi:hypothetical protein